MFCQKCGAGDQTTESYCRRCGEWLPDMAARTRPGLFRKRTREQKIRKIRLLEIMSAALAFASAVIIFSFRPSHSDDVLHLAGIFCVLIAVYQVVNFYFGLTLQPKRGKNQIENERETGKRTSDLPQSLKDGERNFVELPSVTENTTELFRPTSETERQRPH
jgi:hypothetical protein